MRGVFAAQCESINLNLENNNELVRRPTYSILAVVSNVETIFDLVPENGSMLFAHCILVWQIEVIRIVQTLLPADVDFKAT